MNEWIRVNRAAKRYGKRTVLREVSFSVPRGCIFGLLGPSGAGKTTIVKMIAGLEAPSSGTVEVLGMTMPSLSALPKLGYMAQSDALYADLSGYENLDFFASLYGLGGARKAERIDAVLDLVGLRDDRRKKVRHYSGGMKRRLSLAIALLHEPSVLILDEPTVGIDPALRRDIWSELARIRESGTAIVVTTHVMDEAERCDLLAMMRQGEIIAMGTPAEIRASAKADALEDAFLALGRESV